MSEILTAARARALLAYDAETGVLTWRSGRRAGRVAGTTTAYGYRQVSVDGRSHRAHRVAWLIHYGAWPAELDHCDGDRTNNAIANLREATHAQNQQNRPAQRGNSTGLKGVYPCKKAPGWFHAAIHVNRQRKYLGRFATPQAAHAAYAAAAAEHHKQFANLEARNG